MPAKNFTHLHFHTQYSLLDGACKIKEAVKHAKSLEMPGLAISDHGVMYGAIEFYRTCMAEGIKPIIGCEMYITDNRMTERKREANGKQSFHLLLLAKNLTGYKNLIRLTSGAHLEGFYYKPRIDKEFLAQHSEGLIGTTGCLAGEVPQLIMDGDVAGARERMGVYEDILGKENYFVELQDHGLSEQRMVNQELIKIASQEDMNLIATNDVHYVKRQYAEAHEVMLCMQTGSVMSDPKRLKYGSYEFYMKSADEMWELFGKDHPEAIHNTVKITEMVDTDLGLDRGDVHFPNFDLPEGHDPESYLRHLVQEGIAKRYDIVDFNKPKTEFETTVRDRIETEIEVIRMKGFLNYFIVVADFTNWAKDTGIPVGPGRGSGAGSIVAYSLNITTVDPLKYGLLFERFLNPERDSPPDFDIDFCMTKRPKVIEYVKNKYGMENCANIITFGTMGAKSVIRDLARVLEIPLNEADRLAKLVPDKPGTTLASAMEDSPDFRNAVNADPSAKTIMKYAPMLEGLIKSCGVHAAGIVMGEMPLIDLVPLSRDKEGMPITQYEMATVEQTGLLKMDFLGLKTLTVVQEALDNIEKSTGEKLIADDLPLDDEKSFELLTAGDTVGVFQVESGGMQDMLRKFKPKKFEDIIALIALYRPGPMQFIEDFIARSLGLVEVKYDHPLLETILKETHGYMVYQEQVQRAANLLAGYTLAQGDILRRAMGKKKASVMAAQREMFVNGCKEVNEIPAKLAGKIFDDIEQFAGYGFNKSHSAAYAVITMQTAWLKAHYPREFMAALMSCEMGNPEKLSWFIGEALKMEIEVRPPDVNNSDDRFRAETDGIRFGLSGVKNVGQGAVEEFVKERESGGQFEGLTDFCMRVDSSVAKKNTLEALILCGAFDFSGNNRAAMAAGVEAIMGRAAADLKDKLAGQGNLFDLMAPPEGDVGKTKDELPDVDPFDDRVRLAKEKELVGFYISGHPLKEYEWALNTFSLLELTELAEQPQGTITRVGGLVTAYRKLYTKKNQDPMCAFTLEGIRGTIEVVMFPDHYRNFGEHIGPDLAIMMACERMDEDNKVQCHEAYPLGEAHKHYCEGMAVQFDGENLDEKLMDELRNLIERHPGDIPLELRMMMDTAVVAVVPEQRLWVEPNSALGDALGALVGSENIETSILQTPRKRVIERNFMRSKSA